MAVVQISRIQIRRGRANSSGTGFPQLASGELGWAIDSQELYIGNGSVAEGAPAVGNTKVLTEQDLSVNGNILNLISYIYRNGDTSIQTGPSSNSPITRPILQRLDDIVSTKAFGAVGNYNSVTKIGTDDTMALQRAIYNLYLNSQALSSNDGPDSLASRVILNIPAGRYRISSTIFIPSYATLIGAGVNKTVLYYDPVRTITGTSTVDSVTIITSAAMSNMKGCTVEGTGIPTGTTISSVAPGVSLTLSQAATATGTASLTVTCTGPAIQFVNTLTTTTTVGDPNNTTSERAPKFIMLKDFSIVCGSNKLTALQLDSVRDSLFENLKLITVSAFNNSGIEFQEQEVIPIIGNDNTSIGINMFGVSPIVTCERNLFKNIAFAGFKYAVNARYDIINNTFKDCYVFFCRRGFNFGDPSTGQQYGPRNTLVENTIFERVYQQAVYIDAGIGNTVQDCKFINVGSNDGGLLTTMFPQVYFTQLGNTYQNNRSERYAGDSQFRSLVDPSTDLLTVPYIGELAGKGVYQSPTTRQTNLTYTNVVVNSLRLPPPTDAIGSPGGRATYEINYQFYSTANNYSRTGTIWITADVDTNKIEISDEYNFSGEKDFETSLEFSSSFLTNTGGLYNGVPGTGPYSLSLRYRYNIANDSGVMTYSFKASY